MGADTWQIERDIGLARLRKDTKEVERLKQTLTTHRDKCSHEFRVPEGGVALERRCWKCGRLEVVAEQKEAYALVPGRDSAGDW
jgi:hypothetical protein